MPLSLTQFYHHLSQQPLKPVYCIGSDENLLCQEAQAALRKTAQSQGVRTREKYHTEPGFSFDNFFTSLQNFNLFSEKILIELILPTPKLDDKTSKRLQHYLTAPAEDKILVIQTSKLSSAQLKARWHKLIEEKGISLSIRSLTKQEYPAWIMQRAKAFNLTLSRECITLITEATEGNLTATQQILLKLCLLDRQNTIDANSLIPILSNNARYTVFDLGHALLAGNARECIRTLQGLKETGVELTLVLWSLCRELRTCLQYRHQYERGATLNALLQKEWQSRRTVLKQALTRLTETKLQNLLRHAAKADLIIKGQLQGNPWQEIEVLSLAFCGVK